MKIWLPKLNYYSKRLTSWQEKFWREVNHGKPFMGILDNVAGRRYFEYATFGRSGVQQSNSKLFGMQIEPIRKPIKQEMTSVGVFPYGTVAAAGVVESGLTTQIDRGSEVYDVEFTGTSGTNEYLAYGYGIANECYHNGLTVSFGSIDANTYNDGGGTTRTIKAMYDTEAGGSGGGDVYFSLDTASVPNSDTTWLDFTWDNISGTPTTTDRSVDTTYYASINGSSHWRDLTPSTSYTDLDANTDFVITTS